MKKHTFVVSLTVDATQKEAAVYVRDSVRCWGGGYQPGDPFFSLKDKAVRVAPNRRNREERLQQALQQLLQATESRGASDSRLPIAWSGSSEQLRALWAAQDNARKLLKKKGKK